MARLSSTQILQENKSRDVASISSLSLTHRALSDVSCLAGFKNLGRLDLSSNNLFSLEGLHSCINLKWLCVVQNKLKSLKGIEGLSKLMVLNAGKNELTSMDDIRSLVSLKALILNDNKLTSISRLDGLQQLNTLVLSRNPIRLIGDSLVKVKSITKLSASNCQIESIGSSLMSCRDLKEVRLAHNEITTLPPELAHNGKVQNLDLGHNLISRLSDVKVLSSFSNLKNLNLQGNPISEKAKLDKKVKKLLPGLQIFNGKPVERSDKYEKLSEKHILGSSKSSGISAEVLDAKKAKESDTNTRKSSKKLSDQIVCGQDESDVSPDAMQVGITEEKSKRKSSKKNKMDVEENLNKNDNQQGTKLAGIDNGEIPFSELIFSEGVENPPKGHKKKKDRHSTQDAKSLSGLVSISSKRKKMGKGRGVGLSALESLSSPTVVGLGGPSAWDAE